MSETPSPPPSWYADGLPFECTQCGNCCKSHGSYAYVYLAEADIEAIADHLKLERDAFIERYCQQEDGWVSLRMDQPACPFLDPKNRCSIYSVRPMQCRTWPFWRENLERAAWEGPVRDCCPGTERGPRITAEEIDRIAAESEAWYDA